MARKHNYVAPVDYGLYTDRELEAANLKVRVAVANSTIRKPGESASDHYRRFYAEFQSKKKRRDMFGNII